MRAVVCLVVTLMGSGCATSHVSPARFVSRSPTGGVVATPRAEVGMDDANAMIAAHCGGGGYAISCEGEAVVGDTVVTEAAASVDAQTTEGRQFQDRVRQGLGLAGALRLQRSAYRQHGPHHA